ncbi:aldose epimerase family protein [Pareuzebyella sediminis]|uniref:aldose epimerase family protein n=1 Tax=Pareuzebyella sediminis TaxID=2607998 RepID=UPI0011ECFE09|nr:aldose epimerase family protein [Pareuzebyella sediminis]
MKSFKRNLRTLFSIGLLLLGLTSCKEQPKNEKTAEPMEQQDKTTINKSSYGSTPEGTAVDLYTLTNDNGMEVDIITYGGRITKLSVPDKEGKSANVVLNFDSLDQYLKTNPFFGALVGRYGNRIGGAQFSLDGTEYKLAANNGENSLHGGLKGFDKVVWDVEEAQGGDSASLKLNYVSQDMEEGFPGKLDVTVTYTLTGNNALEVNYEATTDKKTVVNLTQHAYFNLSGDFSQNILDHVLTLNADQYVPVNDALIPTGELRDVEGTPFDFTSPKEIGKDIDADNDQIKKGGGYDHCWVLNDQNSGMRTIATAYHPETGRSMEVATTEPGVQFYTGNFLDGTLPIPGGGNYGKRSGFCLETQHYPDSPNQPEFPSVVLNPGEKYETKTTFTFSTK